MKGTGHIKRVSYWFLAIILLLISGSVMMARTINQYNNLSLQRQDQQLEELSLAVDANIASQLNNIRKDLRYVISRRGFLEAEKQWQQIGDHADLLGRIKENLIMQNPMIHAMLAVHDDEIILSTDGNLCYYFPAGMTQSIQPCQDSDGRMYLALFEESQHLRYAVLVSMADWYSALTEMFIGDDTRLFLLGSQRKMLLHEWQGQQHSFALDNLNESDYDQQAIRCMLATHLTGQRQTISYDLTYPGEEYVHEMRMTTVPLSACENGYFIVGLVCDYDEIILPMHTAAFRLLISGILLLLGFLLLSLIAFQLVRQGRHRDRELEQLTQLNQETQNLLEKTKELAHHQRLETIGTLTASIAHEFNNLLTPIMGYAILTLEGLPEDCEELADNVAEIYESSRKAKDIISRLNELSRKSPETHFAPLDLARIAEKAMQVASPAQPPRVTSRIIQDDHNLIVSGNETQLAQLMLNLILNAFHAMERTGGALTLTLRAEGNEAVMLVQDEGTGIPQEIIPHIFDPFFTTKESGRGTGLGLPIVLQVVQSHHGHITVESTVDHGTTFTLRLPMTNIDNQDIS